MQCPRCQHENAPDAKFCDECGTPQAGPCPVCGTEHRPGARFCKACGVSFRASASALSPSQPTPLPPEAESRFQALLPEVMAFIQRDRRSTYRRLKYVFSLDEALLGEIRQELTKMLLESDLLYADTDRYTLTGSLATAAIPATLQDSLMARLDRLPTGREVAQLGAVLGREFAYEMLQALAVVEDATLQEGLSQLVGSALLYQRGRPPRATYAFRHALIRDTAYQSLLRRTRQHYHQQVAQLLEARFPEVVEAQLELVAYHYTEAACPEQAIGYWQQAGQRAARRSANQEAVRHLTTKLSKPHRSVSSGSSITRPQQSV